MKRQKDMVMQIQWEVFNGKMEGLYKDIQYALKADVVCLHLQA